MSHAGLEPGITFLICTHNGAARLPATLEHLQRVAPVDGVPLRVLLVDNASTDESAQVATRLWTRRDMPITVLPEPQRGLTHATRTGVSNAGTTLTILVDDDNWVQPDFAAVAWHAMQQQPRAAALGGVAHPAFETKAPSWFWARAGAYAVGSQAPHAGDVTHEVAGLWGAGLVLRTHAVQALWASGFTGVLAATHHWKGRGAPVRASGGDVELCMALRLAGWQLHYTPHLQLQHWIPAARLQWSYLESLMRGGAHTQPWLACYAPPGAGWPVFAGAGQRQWVWDVMKTVPATLARALEHAHHGNQGNLPALDLEVALTRLHVTLAQREQLATFAAQVAQAPWNVLSRNKAG